MNKGQKTPENRVNKERARQTKKQKQKETKIMKVKHTNKQTERRTDRKIVKRQYNTTTILLYKKMTGTSCKHCIFKMSSIV